MHLLEGMPDDSIDNLRWCFYAPDGRPEEDLKRVPRRVSDLVTKKHGRLVPIPGFDEIMLLLQRQMSSVVKMPNLRERMQERAKQRHELYSKQESELNERVSGKAKATPPASATHAAPDVNALLKDAMVELAATNKVKPWWQWDNEAEDAASVDERNEIYQRGLAALPESSELLGCYALFLLNERKEMDKAEEFYKRAIEADPKQADNLGNYAVFLAEERKEMDKAEEFYQRAIEADPKNANALGNYATFLKNERKEMGKAEEFYQRAIEANPKHANNLGNYAIFLQSKRKETDKAEEFYKRAIDADPKQANILGNYSQLCFLKRRLEEGMKYLKQAEALGANDRSLAVELVFYRLAHDATSWPDKLLQMAELLALGARSPNWPLEGNVAIAEAARHPNPALLRAIAGVISHNEPLEGLSKFPEWPGHKAVATSAIAKPSPKKK